MKTILIWLTLFTPALALDYNLGYQPVLVSLPTPPLTSTPVRQMQTAASAPGTQYTARAGDIFAVGRNGAAHDRLLGTAKWHCPDGDLLVHHP